MLDAISQSRANFLLRLKMTVDADIRAIGVLRHRFRNTFSYKFEAPRLYDIHQVPSCDGCIGWRGVLRRATGSAKCRRSFLVHRSRKRTSFSISFRSSRESLVLSSSVYFDSLFIHFDRKHSQLRRSIARQTSNDHFVDWTQFAIYLNICLF